MEMKERKKEKRINNIILLCISYYNMNNIYRSQINRNSGPNIHFRIFIFEEVRPKHGGLKLWKRNILITGIKG